MTELPEPRELVNMDWQEFEDRFCLSDDEFRQIAELDGEQVDELAAGLDDIEPGLESALSVQMNAVRYGLTPGTVSLWLLYQIHLMYRLKLRQRREDLQQKIERAESLGDDDRMDALIEQKSRMADAERRTLKHIKQARERISETPLAGMLSG